MRPTVLQFCKNQSYLKRPARGYLQQSHYRSNPEPKLDRLDSHGDLNNSEDTDSSNSRVLTCDPQLGLSCGRQTQPIYVSDIKTNRVGATLPPVFHQHDNSIGKMLATHILVQPSSSTLQQTLIPVFLTMLLFGFMCFDMEFSLLRVATSICAGSCIVIPLCGQCMHSLYIRTRELTDKALTPNENSRNVLQTELEVSAEMHELAEIWPNDVHATEVLLSALLCVHRTAWFMRTFVQAKPDIASHVHECLEVDQSSFAGCAAADEMTKELDSGAELDLFKLDAFVRRGLVKRRPRVGS